jgi:hypothetical protein
MSENWMLRSIFGSKREELDGRWRKWHYNLDDLYSALSIIIRTVHGK